MLQNYYKERQENDIWNAFSEWQANQLRQREELQRLYDEKKAETERKRVLLEHSCSLFDQRVEKLAYLGPQMLATLTAMSQAIDSNNFDHFMQSVYGMDRIPDAATEIYTEMQREIMLETKGAQTLKESWPLEALDQTFKSLEQVVSTLNAEVQGPVGWMLQSIRNVCHPIATAQPFNNPLANESSSPFVVQPIPINFEAFMVAMRPQVTDQAPPPTYQASQFAYQAPQYQAPASQLPQQQAPVAEKAEEKYASFGDMMKAHAAKASIPTINVIPPSEHKSTAAADAPSSATPGTETPAGTATGSEFASSGKVREPTDRWSM